MQCSRSRRISRFFGSKKLVERAQFALWGKENVFKNYLHFFFFRLIQMRFLRNNFPSKRSLSFSGWPLSLKSCLESAWFCSLSLSARNASFHWPVVLWGYPNTAGKIGRSKIWWVNIFNNKQITETKFHFDLHLTGELGCHFQFSVNLFSMRKYLKDENSNYRNAIYSS